MSDDHHAPVDFGHAFKIGMALNVGFIVIEVVFGLAAVGVVINGITAALFMSGRKSDLNIRGAFIHMAADAAVSAGVVLAGFGILLAGWQWLDSATSLIIAILIFIGTWGLFKDAFNLALDAVPRDVDAAHVRDYLSGLPGVLQVHDLHIWGMSTTEVALTAHLVKPDSQDDDLLIAEIEDTLQRRFGIGHITIQWQRDASTLNCEGACEG